MHKKRTKLFSSGYSLLVVLAAMHFGVKTKIYKKMGNKRGGSKIIQIKMNNFIGRPSLDPGVWTGHVKILALHCNLNRYIRR